MKIYLIANDAEDTLVDEEEVNCLASAKDVREFIERYNPRCNGVIEYELEMRRYIDKDTFMKERKYDSR
jgi:hypothetical protein